MDQLKRKNQEEEGDSKKKAKKDVELSEWSSTELGKDESKNLELALKHALKDGVYYCLKMINTGKLMHFTSNRRLYACVIFEKRL